MILQNKNFYIKADVPKEKKKRKKGKKYTLVRVGTNRA